MDVLIKRLKTKNIHIVGVSGTEGSAVLEFLAANGIKNITAHDFSADQSELEKNFFKTHLWLKGNEKREALEKFLESPMKLKLKRGYLEGIAEADMIFAPSSWRLYKPNFPALEEALKKGIEFSSLTKLYFQLAKGRVISVTGTKGKGTTSRLIYNILSKSKNGQDVYLAGNDRRSAQELDKVSKMKKEDILVLETSNRQLTIDLGRCPNIGVITNISPDHIDEHGSFEKYIEVKKSLFKRAGKSLPAGRQGDIAVLNYDNEITKKIGEQLAERELDIYFFSRKVSPRLIRLGRKKINMAFVEEGKIYITEKGNQIYISDLSDIKLIGEHNIENVLAAALAGYLAGAKPEAIREAIKDFHGLPHRLGFIGEYGGARFYDDLASTNPESTIAAIKAIYVRRLADKIYDSRIILVAGGDDKGMDYAKLAKEIIDKVDILILLPGTGTDIIKHQISNVKSQRTKFFGCDNFLEAMDMIKTQTKAGDIVLISPASAHFQDRYIDILKKPLRNIIVEKFR